MKLIIILTSLVLTACGSGGGGSNTSQPNTTPPSAPGAPTQPVIPGPTPTPTPPPAIVCAPFNGTRWVADGSPTLNPLSQDQFGQPAYVAEFNLSVSNPTFVEHHYYNPGFYSCTRIFNDMVSAGTPYSYVWTDTSGQCGAVVNWFQFDASVCNVLKVTLRTGSGAVYELQNYKPF